MLGFVGLLGAETLVARTEEPNVIFIHMDHMGYSDVSRYRAEKVNTPNIDCMLAEGAKPNREAHWFLDLNPDAIAIAEQFKKQGYTTAKVGKWHLGMQLRRERLRGDAFFLGGIPDKR